MPAAVIINKFINKFMYKCIKIMAINNSIEFIKGGLAAAFKYNTGYLPRDIYQLYTFRHDYA